MNLILNKTHSILTLLATTAPMNTRDIIVTVLGYGLALALVSIVFYLLYRYFYKKHQDDDPSNKLGKF